MELSESVTHKNGRLRKPVVSNSDMGERESKLEVECDEETLLPNSVRADGQAKACHGIKGELGNVALLLFLYVLQGIPLGLAGSIPLIMQSKNVSYKDQAYFSFVFWPFSLKLFWAPLVDSLYLRQFGRRKSWLVPTQYLLGLFMLYLSVTVDAMLQTDGQSGPDVIALTAVFFVLAFLAATQDIAVDGWALTMLSRENVGYASTCNSVGQTAGYFLGNVLFLALESADFCNKYLRFEPQERGIPNSNKPRYRCIVRYKLNRGPSACRTVALYSMYVACMAFHAKVSDPVIGGTYMTLLNTVTNLGGNWPSTLALWLVDPLTFKECQGAPKQTCGSVEELCVREGGTCVTTLDGYYVESVVCVLIGLCWWMFFGKRMKRIQEESPSAWHCRAVK
uniref:Solute carrier family 33 member 1 n=1 Tax=Sinocyclocheilus grahami TaxID=75366 RepID=A0A672MXK5_SINGR